MLKTTSPSGEYAVIEVTVTDAAGNDSPTASESLLIATVSPDPPVFDTAPHHTNTTPLQWQWHSGGGGNGNYRYKVNDLDLTTGALTQTDTTPPVSYTYNAPADGEYTLYVQEQNNYENWSDTASLKITLDRVVPVVIAPADITVLAISGSGTPDSYPDIADFLDAATAFDVVDGSLSAEPVPATPSTFPIGTTTVTFSATDSAGNTGTDTAMVTVVDEDIAVTAPNGGEVWGAGGTHSITWSSSRLGQVKIELYKNGSWNSNIAASTANDGSYSWDIPAGKTLDSDYRIRISSVPVPAENDQSNGDFTIEKITVTAPNGGQDWGVGTTRSITWSSSSAGDVKIELLKGGIFDSTIDTSTSNDGSYSWTIPSGQATGSDYSVGITTLTTPEYSDESDAYFTISP
jgi:hypothetical protein